MAITLIMLSMGWIPFHMACAMVLGENIGTTITANIAASVGNTQAKRAAMSHTIFNLFGVIWALILFKPFTALVGKVIELFGLPNPAAEGFAVVEGSADTSTAALYGLSMLHTLFNTINTLILVWFIKLIEKAVVWIIKPKSQDKETFRLKYISAGPLATPELSLEEAFNEIIHFAKISRNGLGYAKQAIETSDEKVFEEMYGKLIKYEEISDRIEYEIAAFLNGVSSGEVSEATSMKIKAMYKIIGELESLGDSGESIARILSRRNSHKKSFDAETIAKLLKVVEAVDQAYIAMIANLEAAHAGALNQIQNAYDAEEEINTLRNDLREGEIEAIESNAKNYQTSVYYMDIVSKLEGMGDFIINVSQSLERAFVEK
jgi:phosphate:Na+ symporter